MFLKRDGWQNCKFVLVPEREEVDKGGILFLKRDGWQNCKFVLVPEREEVDKGGILFLKRDGWQNCKFVLVPEREEVDKGGILFLKRDGWQNCKFVLVPEREEVDKGKEIEDVHCEEGEEVFHAYYGKLHGRLHQREEVAENAVFYVFYQVGFIVYYQAENVDPKVASVLPSNS